MFRCEADMGKRERSPSKNITTSFRALLNDELPTGTIALAKFLLGKVLVRDGDDGQLTGRIVETEAYPPGDDAGHARSGHTARNASLFEAAGHVYVYRAYGISMMLNMSSEREGVGAGVLIRAVEPLTGLDAMKRRRGIDDVYRLTRGPGCLTQAFGIDLRLDGTLYAPGNALWIADDGSIRPAIGTSVRIGITRNPEKPWRYYVRGSRWVSGPRWLNGAPRAAS
jgi:DNA-3-methyladenine glycosylase